jgi:hypothetical protein
MIDFNKTKKENKMTNEQIKNSPDFDLQVRELKIEAGKTLIGGNGVEIKITEVTPHLDIFKGELNGKGSIK